MNHDKEELEYWLGDSGTSSHTIYINNNLTYVEEWNIYVMIRNDHNMNCELKGLINMKLKSGEKSSSIIFSMYCKWPRTLWEYQGSWRKGVLLKLHNTRRPLKISLVWIWTQERIKWEHIVILKGKKFYTKRFVKQKIRQQKKRFKMTHMIRKIGARRWPYHRQWI